MTFSTTGFGAVNPSILYESDGDIFFNFTAVPEPPFVLAVCLGAAAFIRTLRRKRGRPIPVAALPNPLLDGTHRCRVSFGRLLPSQTPILGISYLQPTLPAVQEATSVTPVRLLSALALFVLTLGPAAAQPKGFTALAIGDAAPDSPCRAWTAARTP